MTIWEKLQDEVIKPLQEEVEVPITQTNTTAEKPPYPFLSYNITSPYIPEAVLHNKTAELVPAEQVEFDYDIETTHIFRPTCVISINSHALEEVDVSDNVMELGDEAHKKALQAWHWFRVKGQDHLKHHGLVVVNVGPIQDRDVIKEVNYEMRKGFDVTLRFVDVVETRVVTIEEVEIELKESDSID